MHNGCHHHLLHNHSIKLSLLNQHTRNHRAQTSNLDRIEMLNANLMGNVATVAATDINGPNAGKSSKSRTQQSLRIGTNNKHSRQPKTKTLSWSGTTANSSATYVERWYIQHVIATTETQLYRFTETFRTPNNQRPKTSSSESIFVERTTECTRQMIWMYPHTPNITRQKRLREPNDMMTWKI